MADDKLVKQEVGLTQRESFIAKGDVSGTEDIALTDLRLPRLAIAQGLSDQMIETSSMYIPGLKLFEMYNDLTGEIYGKGPITILPVRYAVKYIEFIPRAEGGGIRDFSVPTNDPRCFWRDGKPPVATRFTEFVVLMLDENGVKTPEPIVLSIKETNKFNRFAAQRLATNAKLKGKPIYAGIYTVSSKPEKNDSGTFGVYIVQCKDWLDNPTVTDAVWDYNQSLYNFARNLANELKGKTIVAEPEDYIDTTGMVDDGEM